MPAAGATLHGPCGSSSSSATSTSSSSTRCTGRAPQPCLSLPVAQRQRSSSSMRKPCARCSAQDPSHSPSTTSMTTVERPASIVIPAVNVTLPPRAPPSLPRPVPIVHSSAYLQQEEQEGFNLFYSSDSEDSRPSSSSSSTSLAPSSGSSSSSSEPFRGSALEWALQRVDRSLDEVELHPHPVQQQIYDISRGPVGQVTGKGLAAAAELTYKASIEAAKVAAPLGRWALGAGAKAAVGLVQFAMVEAHKAKEREKEGTRKEKKGKGKGKGGK